MNAFNDLETKAKAALLAEEAKAKGWFATHKVTIIVGVVSFLLGLILPHIL